ncbi:M23 family metallopeptidase [Rhodococcus sp. WMMA185]|uniref:M23 family metallopeptidase n=1 Tax=Rhodococcus sp. WMMA185 TaxID=679318 RepID=UPI000878A034|nr:M23 family metallopeptidase [Rhodococcus sp. WMMA185]
MGSHHRTDGSSVRIEIDPDAARGRHRNQQAGTGVGVKAATVAAATGAIAVGGAQLGAASAAAAPVESRQTGGLSLPGLPFEIPANLLPPGFELPPELADVAQNLGVQHFGAPDPVAPAPVAPAPVAPDPVVPSLGAQAQQWFTSINPIKPRTVQPVSGTLTSKFGPRWGAHHGGIDIAAPIGAPVLAAADGQVIDAGPISGFGLWVRLLHDDGTTTVYGHINDYSVNVGQRVVAGQQIATVGNRGQSTGPHLHFEVHDANGVKIDPGRWLTDRGVSVTWDGAARSA